MSILDETKPNTCPYCGAPYTIAYAGCRDKCPGMQRHERFMRVYLESEEQLERELG